MMNDLSTVIKRKEKEFTFDLGLSTLHAKIRFMELVLKISYNMEFKKWSTRNNKEWKKSKEERKRDIQKRLRTEIGIYVDMPRSGGSGNSNDGNTARRFFDAIEIVATITNFDIRLLQKFRTILEVICCGKKVDAEKFGRFAMDTAKLYVELYPWYYMPSSVHKILIHGAKIINHHTVPIGMLSEEAQEHRNKDLKEFRRKSRKCSRTNSNEDIIHTFCTTSDLLISTLRRKDEKPHRPLSDEALELLIE